MPPVPETKSASRATIGRRERNKLDKLLRIRSAAAALFSELGYEKTTTQAVAERADIGAGTLFLYASTKEDLLNIVMSGDIRDIVHKLRKSVPSRKPLPEQALHIFGGLLRYHARDKDLSRFYVREFTIPRHQKRSAWAGEPPAPSIVDIITELVTREQSLGRVRTGVSAATIAWGLFSLYYMALARFLLGAMTLQQSLGLMRESFRLFSSGLSPLPLDERQDESKRASGR